MIGYSGYKGLEKLEKLEKSNDDYQKQLETTVGQLSVSNYKIYKTSVLSKKNALNVVQSITSTGVAHTLDTLNDHSRAIQKLMLKNAYNKNFKILVYNRINQRKAIAVHYVEAGSMQAVSSIGFKLKRLYSLKEYSNYYARNIYQAAKSRALVSIMQAHRNSDQKKKKFK